MPAGGAESGAAARCEGGGLSAARLRQEARYPQVEVTRDSIAHQEWPSSLPVSTEPHGPTETAAELTTMRSLGGVTCRRPGLGDLSARPAPQWPIQVCPRRCHGEPGADPRPDSGYYPAAYEGRSHVPCATESQAGWPARMAPMPH